MAIGVTERAYVMVRPQEAGAIIQVFKKKEYKNEKRKFSRDELYTESFNSFVLNAEGLIHSADHKILLGIVMNSIGLILTHELPKEAQDFRENFMNNASDEARNEALDVFFLGKTESPIKNAQDLLNNQDGDHESFITAILNYQLKLFLTDAKKTGFVKAINKYSIFYEILFKIFKELPVCYIYSLIDTHEILTTKGKKRIQAKAN